MSNRAPACLASHSDPILLIARSSSDMPSSWLVLGAAALAGQAAAFPGLADQYAAQSSEKGKRVNGISPGFDVEAQRIDVSGEHAFVPPGPGDKRGPCPGLNALANQ